MHWGGVWWCGGTHPQLSVCCAALPRLLRGAEPLLKVRLTPLADGCVVGITLAHAVADGLRVPLLLDALAEHYRRAAAGDEGAGGATALRAAVEATDRSYLTSANLADKLIE